MGSRPTIIICPGAEEAAQEAARRTGKIAKESVAERGVFRFVLAGGSTPKRLYEILASGTSDTPVDWSRAHFFWGDERCVDPEDRESNYRMARDALLDPLKIQASQVHRMRGESRDPDAAAREYETIIRDHFNIRASDLPPTFDLVLLGMGADGHIASLFPDTKALDEPSRWVVPNQAPTPPTGRITLTYPVINRAHNVLFLVIGSDKAGIAARALEGERNPRALPAQGVAPVSGNLVWLLDKAAAAGLCGPMEEKTS